MVFGKETLLSSEQEELFKNQLENFRDNLGWTAKQIAKELEFGKTGSTYEKLEVNHIYFYVCKFNLKRKIKKRRKVVLFTNQTMGECELWEKPG